MRLFASLKHRVLPSSEWLFVDRCFPLNKHLSTSGSSRSRISRHAWTCSLQPMCFLGSLVNSFTFFCELRSRSARCTVTGNAQRRIGTPNRAVRRVHVMPWATPIRRIGIAQRGRLPGGDDAGCLAQPSHRGCWNSCEL